jgi:hypothetical protein
MRGELRWEEEEGSSSHLNSLEEGRAADTFFQNQIPQSYAIR